MWAAKVYTPGVRVILVRGFRVQRVPVLPHSRSVSTATLYDIISSTEAQRRRRGIERSEQEEERREGGTEESEDLHKLKKGEAMEDGVNKKEGRKEGGVGPTKKQTKKKKQTSIFPSPLAPLFFYTAPVHHGRRKEGWGYAQGGGWGVFRRREEHWGTVEEERGRERGGGGRRQTRKRFIKVEPRLPPAVMTGQSERVRHR